MVNVAEFQFFRSFGLWTATSASPSQSVSSCLISREQPRTVLSRNVPSIYTFDIFPGPNGPTIKKNEESNAFRGKLVFIPLHSSLLGQCRIPTAWWVRPVPRERRIADSWYCGCTVPFCRSVLTAIEGRYEA